MSHQNPGYYLQQFEQWFNGLKRVKANAGPANGTVAAALVVLEKLKTDYQLDIKDHLAQGGAQIKGVSGPTLAAILKKFNELRPFAKEGGRTNRGVPVEISSMLDTLSKLNIDAYVREDILTSFQSFLVTHVRNFHNRQRLKLIFNQTHSTREIIIQLLKDAKETGKAGPVAQHLVGAKLQLRYPDLKVTNESFSTADVPTGREGDFFIGNTVFHITVSPMTALYEKCRLNISKGLRVYLLVSDDRLLGARQNIIEYCGSASGVESIESFVSQNIEEIGRFDSDTVRSGLRQLIELYNKRVDEAEIDKSIMIDIPENLK